MVNDCARFVSSCRMRELAEYCADMGGGMLHSFPLSYDLSRVAIASEGWRHDVASGYVFITDAVEEDPENSNITNEHLQQLTDYAVHLARA